jgi:hypothetical protein
VDSKDWTIGTIMPKVALGLEESIAGLGETCKIEQVFLFLSVVVGSQGIQVQEHAICQQRIVRRRRAQPLGMFQSYLQERSFFHYIVLFNSVRLSDRRLKESVINHHHCTADFASCLLYY